MRLLAPFAGPKQPELAPAGGVVPLCAAAPEAPFAGVPRRSRPEAAARRRACGSRGGRGGRRVGRAASGAAKRACRCAARGGAPRGWRVRCDGAMRSGTSCSGRVVVWARGVTVRVPPGKVVFPACDLGSKQAFRPAGSNIAGQYIHDHSQTCHGARRSTDGRSHTAHHTYATHQAADASVPLGLRSHFFAARVPTMIQSGSRLRIARLPTSSRSALRWRPLRSSAPRPSVPRPAAPAANPSWQRPCAPSESAAGRQSQPRTPCGRRSAP